MARPTQEAIKTFVGVTGASVAVALRNLEEHGGDLNEAINAHFNEEDNANTNQVSGPAPDDDDMEIDDPTQNELVRTSFPISSAAQDRDHFSLLESNFPQSFSIGAFGTGNSSDVSRVSHPRGDMELPTEFRDDDREAGYSGETAHRLEIHETVIVNDDDGDVDCTQGALPDHGTSTSVGSSFGRQPRPSAPLLDLNDYNDVEEEMVKAVIEASKREAEQHELITKEMEEQPLVRNHSRHTSYQFDVESTESGQVNDGSTSSPHNHMNSHPPYTGHALQTDEWGGISSEEHDEAVMLEAAMFGSIPEGMGYGGFAPRHQVTEPSSHGNSSQYPRGLHPPSPALADHRLLREQQDDEYLAALIADREKELKAKQEAELHHLEEVEKKKQEEEESHRKKTEEEEFERELAAKEASLPKEPSSDDENAVTLLVRMPDGSRRGRRFFKSDKLQFLFYYIDIGRIVKAGSYRLVRTYPRRAFANEESELSLNELGLTSKQEALFLELI